MPRRWTLEAFEAFVTGTATQGGASTVNIYARAPYRIAPCSCGDINCHGWRIVEVETVLETYRGEA